MALINCKKNFILEKKNNGVKIYSAKKKLSFFFFSRLQHLPVAIAQCNLTALWLSENQAKPKIALQRDTDESTGEEVLTCFLLPQQAYHTESMGEESILLQI